MIIFFLSVLEEELCSHFADVKAEDKGADTDELNEFVLVLESWSKKDFYS